MRGRPRPALRDAAVLLGLAVYALPFFWQVLTSLKPEAELMRLPPLLPSRLSWEHYQVVLERSLMLRALVNSLGVGLLTTGLALTLGLAAAYGFARFPVPGKGPLLLAIVAGTAFPQIAIVSPLYLLMRALGLRDTWLGLILANTSFALPLVVWLLAGFIRDLPVALALFPGVFEVPWGDIAAASILASLPPIAVVVGLQRYLVRGLVAGALRE